MLSSTSEYALRIMAILSQQKPDSFLKGDEIAKEAKVPAAYLAKILQSLNKAGLVTAQKGIGGGYILSKPSNQISLFDIVNAVDPFKRITKCPLGIPNHTTLCPLHKKLDDAYGNFQKIFKSCSLNDFANQEQPVLCLDEQQ